MIVSDLVRLNVAEVCLSTFGSFFCFSLLLLINTLRETREEAFLWSGEGDCCEGGDVEDQKRELDGFCSNHKPVNVPRGGGDSHLSIYLAMFVTNMSKFFPMSLLMECLLAYLRCLSDNQIPNLYQGSALNLA